MRRQLLISLPASRYCRRYASGDVYKRQVYARCPQKDGLSMAVYNRLIRAAAFRVIDL